MTIDRTSLQQLSQLTSKEIFEEENVELVTKSAVGNIEAQNATKYKQMISSNASSRSGSIENLHLATNMPATLKASPTVKSQQSITVAGATVALSPSHSQAENISRVVT